MPKDENGIEPVAKNADPGEQWAENEVERRRQLKEARDREEEAVANGRPGRPIDDQDGEEEGEEQAELFPAGSIDGDARVTLKNIVPAGRARKTEAKMRAMPVPLLHGLRRYGEHVELLVTVEAGAVNEVPEFDEEGPDGQRRLLGVKDVQTFRPVHVRGASGMLTVDQVLDILERHFGVTRSADKVREVFGLDAPVAAAR